MTGVATQPCTSPPGAAIAEAELLRRLRARDDRAYEQLVRDYGGRMLAVARRFLPCTEDGADAVQNAFISAFQAIDSFAGDSSLSTWLHRVTVNACLMILRARQRREAAIAGEHLLPQFDATGHHLRRVPDWHDAFTRASAAETRQQVRQCIDRLPASYRAVLLLRDIEELSTEATARLLATSCANVKTRLHRARQMLRTALESAAVVPVDDRRCG